MTSQAQAEEPLPQRRGLVFLGFPLHAPGKPADERARTSADVKVPMLFLQGTRDDFASLELLRPLVKRLGKRATLELFDDADHSFHVPARSGRNDAEGDERAAGEIGALDARAGLVGAAGGGELRDAHRGERHELRKPLHQVHLVRIFGFVPGEIQRIRGDVVRVDDLARPQRERELGVFILGKPRQVVARDSDDFGLRARVLDALLPGEIFHETAPDRSPLS
jgi:hypothetical protein